MSLKRDNFSIKEKRFMKLALNLASERIGLTGNNPSVGCIIVKNDEIISTGQTSVNGRPHAEANAISGSNKKNLNNASMYVSLEPCSHYGKTPPCTKLIIKSKIKKIYYAIDDEDKRSSKKAYPIFRKNNILVKRYLLLNQAKKLYESYFHNRSKEYPYIIGKIACSKDNFISSNKRNITNIHSRNVSHLLRYKNQGIRVTVKTCNKDNSLLNCRLNGLENYSPIRFLLDKNLSIHKKSNLVKTAKEYKTYIFFNRENYQKKNYLTKSGIKLIKCDLNKKKQLNIESILRKIKLNINYLLVEGGKIFTYSMLKNNLFNEFYLFKSNMILKNKGKDKISKILFFLNKTFKNKKKIITYLDNDKIIKYY